MADFPPAHVLASVATAAAEWFPELDGRVTVHVEAAAIRPQSALAVVAVTDRRGASRRVVVKAPFRRSDDAPDRSSVDRPRLGIDPDERARKHELEWRALQAAWSSLGPARAVRPLLHVDGDGVLVLEHVDAPTLRERLDRGDDVVGAVERAGALLADFGSLPALADLEAVRSTPDEVAAAVAAYASFLARSAAASRLARATDAALSRLDGPFTLAAGHGDYAPRNVFVGGDGAVRLIDPLARWRWPSHEDVAYFLLELRLGGRPLRRRGRDQRALRAAFLRGAATPDDDVLAAFEGLVLLDKWAAASTAAADMRRRVRLWRIERVARDLTTRLRA